MIRNVIFDLGGVLIDWNPRYLYEGFFESSEEVDYFLEHICTPEWNAQQDAGRPIRTATERLIKEFPEYEAAIRAYYDQWTSMLGGPIHPNIKLLQEVKDNRRIRLFALTNWSAETFTTAKNLFPFLHWFEGIVVSGEEKVKKPDKRIYTLLLSRYDLLAEESVFIDDTMANIRTAEEIGFHAIHFKDYDQIRLILKKKGVLNY